MATVITRPGCLSVEIMNPAPHSTQLGWQTVAIPVSLMVGAVLTLLVLTGWLLGGDRYAQQSRLGFAGAELQGFAGDLRPDGDTQLLHPSPRQPEAVLRLPLPDALAAQRYSALTLRLEPTGSAPRVLLIWATPAGAGETIRPMSPEADGVYRMALAEDPDWSGYIEALALVIRAGSPAPIRIVRVELEPAPLDVLTLPRQLAGDWLAFEGWRGHSINRIYGGGTEPLIRPVPAAALWLLLSGLVYFAWTRITRRPLAPTPLLAVFLIVWIALDLRWQNDLLHQLTLTRAQYAGKTRDEQRLAAPDGDLYAFARALKTRLPEPPVRVFVVAEDTNNYFALRTKYHLLPHNALNHAPVPEQLQSGHVIVLLDGASQLRHGRAHRPAEGGIPEVVDVLVATGDDGEPIPVRPLLRTPAGQAFEVR